MAPWVGEVSLLWLDVQKCVWHHDADGGLFESVSLGESTKTQLRSHVSDLAVVSLRVCDKQRVAGGVPRSTNTRCTNLIVPTITIIGQNFDQRNWNWK